MNCHLNSEKKTDNIEIWYKFQGTTCRGYDFANILEERVRDGSPEFRVRLVAGTSLQGYDSSNFQSHHVTRMTGQVDLAGKVHQVKELVQCDIFSWRCDFANQKCGRNYIILQK